MLTKLTAAIAAIAIAAGAAANLTTADNATLALASPDAIVSPDAPAKLADAGARLQQTFANVAAPQPKPRARWVAVANWQGQRQ